MPFVSDLSLSPGRDPRVWVLRRELIYRGNEDDFIIPAGFTTDLASTPRLLWALFPPFGHYTRAAIVHDFLYWSKPRSMTRKDADGIFRRIMREAGVPAWRRWTMWAAVRVFGWIAWNRRKHEEA